jgi:hypothetical protein
MSNLAMEKNIIKYPRFFNVISLNLWKSEKRMNFEIIATTLILLLFLVPTISFINAQNDTTPSKENGSVDPEIFVLIRTQAQNREQEIQQLFGDDVLSYKIAQSWMYAQQAMELAKSYEEENSHEAANQYLKAIKHFKNIVKKYLVENPDAYETDTIKLTTASEEIPNITDEEIIAARNLLLNQFQEQFQNQLYEMRKNIDDLQDNMSPKDIFNANQSLIKTEEKLSTIKQKIQTGDYDGILDELDEATNFLYDEFNSLDTFTAQTLQALNKLEAKIQKTIQLSVMKAERGEDSSEEDTILNELLDNKEKIKTEFKEIKRSTSQGTDN